MGVFQLLLPGASSVSQLNALTFAIDCIVTGFAFVFKLLYVEDASAPVRLPCCPRSCRTSARLPVHCPPVRRCLANSARLWRAAFSRTGGIRWCPPRLPFRRDTVSSTCAHCVLWLSDIWLISYRVYLPPLYSMSRALRASRLSCVHAGGAPSSGKMAKKV